MSFKDTIAVLRAWFERIGLALWLHPGEFDGVRRAVLFGAASVVAASALAALPHYRTAAGLNRAPPSVTEMLEILRAVTRHAFDPGQIFKASPPMLALLDGD
jgi:hypothetical protein